MNLQNFDPSTWINQRLPGPECIPNLQPMAPVEPIPISTPAVTVVTSMLMYNPPMNLPSSWHTAEHERNRNTMMQCISHLIHGRRPHASQDWLENLPNVAKKVEERLYHLARSYDEYSDPHSIIERISLLVQSLLREAHVVSVIPPSKENDLAPEIDEDDDDDCEDSYESDSDEDISISLLSSSSKSQKAKADRRKLPKRGSRHVSSQGCSRVFILKVLSKVKDYVKGRLTPSIFTFKPSLVKKWLEEAKDDCRHISNRIEESVYGGPRFQFDDSTTHWSDPNQLYTWWKNNIERRSKFKIIVEDSLYTGMETRKIARAKWCEKIVYLSEAIRAASGSIVASRFPDSFEDRQAMKKKELKDKRNSENIFLNYKKQMKNKKLLSKLNESILKARNNNQIYSEDESISSDYEKPIKPSSTKSNSHSNKDDNGNNYPDNLETTNTFPLILYDIVSSREEPSVSWWEDGTGFDVNDIDRMITKVLPRYYRHNSFTSFQKQLKIYGFRQNKDSNKFSYFHSSFLKSRKDLIRSIHPVHTSSSSMKVITHNSSGSNAASSRQHLLAAGDMDGVEGEGRGRQQGTMEDDEVSERSYQSTDRNRIKNKILSLKGRQRYENSYNSEDDDDAVNRLVKSDSEQEVEENDDKEDSSPSDDMESTMLDQRSNRRINKRDEYHHLQKQQQIQQQQDNRRTRGRPPGRNAGAGTGYISQRKGADPDMPAGKKGSASVRPNDVSREDSRLKTRSQAEDNDSQSEDGGDNDHDASDAEAEADRGGSRKRRNAFEAAETNDSEDDDMEVLDLRADRLKRISIDLTARTTSTSSTDSTSTANAPDINSQNTNMNNSISDITGQGSETMDRNTVQSRNASVSGSDVTDPSRHSSRIGSSFQADVDSVPKLYRLKSLANKSTDFQNNELDNCRVDAALKVYSGSSSTNKGVVSSPQQDLQQSYVSESQHNPESYYLGQIMLVEVDDTMTTASTTTEVTETETEKNAESQSDFDTAMKRRSTAGNSSLSDLRLACVTKLVRSKKKGKGVFPLQDGRRKRKWSAEEVEAAVTIKVEEEEVDGQGRSGNTSTSPIQMTVYDGFQYFDISSVNCHPINWTYDDPAADSVWSINTAMKVKKEKKSTEVTEIEQINNGRWSYVEVKILCSSVQRFNDDPRKLYPLLKATKSHKQIVDFYNRIYFHGRCGGKSRLLRIFEVAEEYGDFHVNNKYQAIMDEMYGSYQLRRWVRAKPKGGRKGALPVVNRSVSNVVADNDSDGEDLSVTDSNGGNTLYCDPTADEYSWNTDNSGARKSYAISKQSRSDCIVTRRHTTRSSELSGHDESIGGLASTDADRSLSVSVSGVTTRSGRGLTVLPASQSTLDLVTKRKGAEREPPPPSPPLSPASSRSSEAASSSQSGHPHPPDIFCICKKEDSGRYIACATPSQLCKSNGWVHLRCVHLDSLSSTVVKSMESYLCPPCAISNLDENGQQSDSKNVDATKPTVILQSTVIPQTRKKGESTDSVKTSEVDNRQSMEEEDPNPSNNKKLQRVKRAASGRGYRRW